LNTVNGVSHVRNQVDSSAAPGVLAFSPTVTRGDVWPPLLYPVLALCRLMALFYGRRCPPTWVAIGEDLMHTESDPRVFLRWVHRAGP